MELKECIRTRRSVRKFKDIPVPHEIMEEIMEDAVLAPSGINTQPWYFVVLESKEAVEECRALMKENAEKFRTRLETRFPTHPEVVESTISYLSSMGGAPVVVLAFYGKPEYDDPIKSNPHLQSMGAAMENLVLSAWDKGVASCWMTAPLEMGVDVAMEERYAQGKGNFIASIALGYPDETPKMPRRRPGKIVYH